MTRRAGGLLEQRDDLRELVLAPDERRREHRQVRRDRGRGGRRVLDERRRRAAEAAGRCRRAPPRAASIISRQVAYRSSGAFAIARAITASSASGSSGRTFETAGGGSVMCANITATSVSRT